MIFAITLSNINKALVLKKYTDPIMKVLLEHYKYLVASSRKEANKLLERRLYNHKIIVKEGKYPKFGLLYKMSQNKL